MTIRFSPKLHVARGKLGPQGTPVHAATFLRRREIVLEEELLGNASELVRILTHELFHFVWIRLGHPVRHEWTEILLREIRGDVKGELGWSSEWRKGALRGNTGRAWKDYVCESFCDTAAWYFSARKRHDEYTLAATARRERSLWFDELIRTRNLSV